MSRWESNSVHCGVSAFLWLIRPTNHTATLQQSPSFVDTVHVSTGDHGSRVGRWLIALAGRREAKLVVEDFDERVERSIILDLRSRADCSLGPVDTYTLLLATR